MGLSPAEPSEPAVEVGPDRALLHVVAVTCAHRGDDARIVQRQARVLLQRGHRVTLVAPRPPDTSDDPPGLVRVDVPRAVGRRRVRSWRAVRRAVGSLPGRFDVLLVHDPELVPLLARRRLGPVVVWDVHEDYAASVVDRAWIPHIVRPLVRWMVTGVESWARRRCRLILAEDAYAERLGAAPVVPNSTWVDPAPSPLDASPSPRVVYVGRASRGRGVHELIRLGERLAGRATVEVIGEADPDVVDHLRSAHDAGVVVWHGYLPNPVAMEHVRGALAGVALLHDEPNYRHSRPTKLVEYLAHGVPVITTPLPLAVELVEASGGGEVVPFGDVEAAAGVVQRWLSQPDERAACARRGHAYVLTHHSWQRDGADFVELLETWAVQPCSR